jgi:glutathione S-transferase
MDAAEDVPTRIGHTIDLPPDAKKKAREELAAGHITHYLRQLQTRLQAAGGEYLADRRLTVADLKVFMLIRWLRSGVLDHIPKDLVDRVAPLLTPHFARMTRHPTIAEYYRRRMAA